MQLEARLRAFAAIARRGSLSRAAEELYVSQPAVSKHLAALENELGSRLVNRGREGATLTPAGEMLAEFVLRAEALLANARRALAAGEEADTGTLSIAASGVPGTYVLPELLARFRDRYPAVTVEFEVTTSAGALDLVRSHRAELAVVGGLTVPAELESEPLVDDDVVLVGPTSLGGRRLRARDLEGLTWVTREEGSATRAAVETARWELGLHAVNSLELPSWEAVKLAVARGAGIAAISRLALELELEAGRLVILDVPRWRVSRTISVLRTRGIPLTPPADRFLALLRETYAPDTAPPNSNLPRLDSPLLGRARELEELRGLVRSGRAVTLTGAGGSGKTRLALEVAAGLVDEFPNGVYFVDLSPLRDPALVRATVAAALALKDPEELAARLHGQRLLLVLDNFEHLVDSARDLTELLESAPSVAVLATSRTPIGVSRERRYRVEPLPLDDAAALFLARAREVNPRFSDGKPVRRICERLDRLPLALELAAARARGTTAAKLANRLEDRLPELAGGRDAPARQRTLTAAIAWSYDLLDESSQELLTRLSVFRGGWPAGAAEAVCGADPADLLALTEGVLTRAVNGRSSMLETVRQFAADRLAEDGGGETLRRRHAEYMLGMAEDARPFARGPEEKATLDRLALELDNFRAALSYAVEADDVALGMTLAEALEPFWIRGMHQREAIRWLEPLLLLEGDVDDAVRAGALTLAGRAAIEAGDVESAEPWFRQGLDLAREAGDETRLAWALHGLGHLLAERGEWTEAEALLEESMELFLRLGQHAPAGGRMTYLAYYAARNDDLGRAEALLERAAEQYGLAGDFAGVGSCIHSLGDLALDRGDPDRAVQRFLEAQPTMIQAGSRLELAYLLAGLAAIAGANERAGLAGRLWGAFERLDAEADRRMETDDRARYERFVGEVAEADLRVGRELHDDEAAELVRDASAELAG
jgi:predicted ATPase/DNA-binding transcriptional LysR family regulator